MKITKSRLKQIVLEELQLQEGGYAGHYERPDYIPGEEGEVVDTDDLISLNHKAIRDSIKQFEEVMHNLAQLTSEPHMVGQFVHMRTQARQIDKALELFLEEYVIQTGRRLEVRDRGPRR